MEAKRRDFLKTLGLGSGLFFGDPVTLFGKSPEEAAQEINKEVFAIRKYETDLVVAGGGMAGVCAAIAAARNGTKVILIQNRSRLGGNASSEIRMHISGASALKQVWRETGILEELVLTEAVENPQRSYEIWDYIMYDKVVSEANITLLLDAIVYDTTVANNRITQIKALCSQTEEIYEIKARFYADCTGDGTMAAKAGAEYMQGREAKSQWNESMAEEVADKKSMGNSLLFTSSRHDRPMPFKAPAWAREYTAKDFVKRPIRQWEYGYWWLELGGLEDIVKDGQKIRHDLMATLFGVWDYIKNSGNHPESANWALSWVGLIPGKRESRRIVGDYIMKQDDAIKDQQFFDRVAYGGWPLDDHPPEGMNGFGLIPARSIPLAGPYSIPLRSLYSKNIKNLWMAGRNVSVSHVALSTTRVMATCALMGQAIGTAAAYCKQRTLDPAGLTSDKTALSQFQQLLLRQDQGLLGVVNADPDDLARKTKVSASSETSEGLSVQVIDGINRDIKDGKTHQWRADLQSGSQWIQLSWDKPVSINRIELTFDTGLQRFLRISPEDSVYKNQVRKAQPETLADYKIEGISKGKNTALVVNEANYLRKVVHDFDTTEVEAIRLTALKTNGDAYARIFEIRCYLEK